MKPYRSSSDKENCSPISSNCVIWQGPDLSCINLCKGDSVSDVVYKLATELCKIKDATDLTDLDLNCVLDLCDGTPEPALTTAAVLQVIIDGLCCSIDGLTTTTNGLTSRTSNLYQEPEVVLPDCLQYIDPATGLPVTTLVLSEYALTTAQALCDLRNTVFIQSTEISDLQTRVTTLENNPGYVPPLVAPSCTYGTVTQGISTNMDVLLSNLDNRVCSFISLVGSNTDVVGATTSQCTALAAQTALSQVGTMSSIPGWQNNVATFAQSMQNLWLTVCDMRAVIYDLKNCCSTADCSAFILGYNTIVSNDRSQVVLIFSPATVIPAGFTNCPGQSTVTISDGDGHTYTATLDLLAYASDPSGVSFTVTGSYLNPALPYTITVNGCIIKGTTTCSKVVTYVAALPTTTTTTSTTTTSSTTTSTTLTTSTTTTTTIACTCYGWTVTPDSADLLDATGNTPSTFDNRIFVDWTSCAGALQPTAVYTTGAPNQPLGCSCNIPDAHYYKNNVKTPCTAGTLSLDGAC
jgi:hypothetical protein